MKRILVLGAGQSSPFLIRYLLDHAEAHGWRVTVADLDGAAASARANGHPRGDAIVFDITDAERSARAIADADLVVNLLAPPFQPRIARACVDGRTHMVSASYESAEIRALDEEARGRGVTLLTEMGLDPGIDHMSTMALFREIREKGGEITDFFSYGGGLPALDTAGANPLHYVITWNPRNVVMAGSAGAQYVKDGAVRCVPYAQVFERTWRVDVPGVGTFDAYPNRDSLGYLVPFGLENARSLVRGTLRYPGYCDVWRHLVRLGLPNEDFEIPDITSRTYAEVLDMYLPAHVKGSTVEERAGHFLGLDADAYELRTMRWLGLFSDERIAASRNTSSQMLVELLGRRLALPTGGRDMVILQHDLTVRHDDARRERVTSTMVHLGEPGGMTAMARTVGQPAAIAVRLILTGGLELAGRQIPTRPEIYEPVLRELAADGIAFEERTRPVEG